MRHGGSAPDHEGRVKGILGRGGSVPVPDHGGRVRDVLGRGRSAPERGECGGVVL